jgi:hypothetical protein
MIFNYHNNQANLNNKMLLRLEELQECSVILTSQKKLYPKTQKKAEAKVRKI